jgi:hypothetical protein
MPHTRNRISKSLGGISSANDLPAIVAAAAPFALRVNQRDLYEQIVDALIGYDIAVELMPANQGALQRRRRELRSAAVRLERLLKDDLAQELADLLHAYPATLVVLGQTPKGDLGTVPIHELRRDLKALRMALDVRVFDSGVGAGPRTAKRCPSFPGLVGALSDAFVASFANADGSQPDTGVAFDRFARAVLSAAGVRPRNDAPFGDWAITDALGTYREWQRAT